MLPVLCSRKRRVSLASPPAKPKRREKTAKSRGREEHSTENMPGHDGDSIPDQKYPCRLARNSASRHA